MPASLYLNLFLGFGTLWLLTSFAAIGYAIS
jgi:hypothetical protein